MLDSFFYLSLIFLTAGVLYFSLESLDNLVTDDYITFLGTVNTFTYLAFVFIVALHINIRFPVIRDTANKLYLMLKHKVKKQKDDNRDLIDISRNESIVTFTELRESLLDSGVL